VAKSQAKYRLGYPFIISTKALKIWLSSSIKTLIIVFFDF